AAIRAAFDWIIEEIIGNPEAGCFAVNAATELGSCDEGVQGAVSRSTARTVTAFADAIRAGQQQGEIPPAKDPQAIAEFLLNAVHGLRVTGKTTQDRRMLENIVNLALSVLD
ncbi:MAG: TetR/AcrR family transcriptional regulator, partial [Akkermansiaceae bacterium]|nr:TetR/AcrR family transcriptional regulator [Armatimonadota bacterium]